MIHTPILKSILSSLVSLTHDYDRFIDGLPIKFVHNELTHIIEIEKIHNSIDYIVIKRFGPIIIESMLEEQFKDCFYYIITSKQVH